MTGRFCLKFPNSKPPTPPLGVTRNCPICNCATITTGFVVGGGGKNSIYILGPKKKHILCQRNLPNIDILRACVVVTLLKKMDIWKVDALETNLLCLSDKLKEILKQMSWKFTFKCL